MRRSVLYKRDTFCFVSYTALNFSGISMSWRVFSESTVIVRPGLVSSNGHKL
jgi:hypothetical protein